MKRIAGLLCVLLAAVAAFATTVVPMSVEELTRAAEAVVEARAADSWSQWNPQHTIIYTYTRFVVQKSLKGSLPEQIVVKQPGGAVGDDAMRVPGVRQFQGGETALLFLRASAASDGSHVVVGLMQGNFRMFQTASGDTAVSNGISGASALQHGAIQSFRGAAMSLREIETRIQEAQ